MGKSAGNADPVELDSSRGHGHGLGSRGHGQGHRWERIWENRWGQRIPLSLVCVLVVSLVRVLAVRGEMSMEMVEASVEPASLKGCAEAVHHCRNIRNSIVADGHTESNAPDLF